MFYKYTLKEKDEHVSMVVYDREKGNGAKRRSVSLNRGRGGLTRLMIIVFHQ